MRKNFWNNYFPEQVWEAVCEGTILRSGLRLKAPRGHILTNQILCLKIPRYVTAGKTFDATAGNAGV